MGLACPVCEVPHPDGEHLADHVAITATTRDGDHRAWLGEHAPDWESMTRTELSRILTEHAEEVDSIDLHAEVEKHQSRGHDHDEGLPDHAAADASAALDEEARAIIAEARKLRERTRGESDADESVETDG